MFFNGIGGQPSSVRPPGPGKPSRNLSQAPNPLQQLQLQLQNQPNGGMSFFAASQGYSSIPVYPNHPMAVASGTSGYYGFPLQQQVQMVPNAEVYSAKFQVCVTFFVDSTRSSPQTYTTALPVAPGCLTAKLSDLVACLKSNRFPEWQAMASLPPSRLLFELFEPLNGGYVPILPQITHIKPGSYVRIRGETSERENETIANEPEITSPSESALEVVLNHFQATNDWDHETVEALLELYSSSEDISWRQIGDKLNIDPEICRQKLISLFGVYAYAKASEPGKFQFETHFDRLLANKRCCCQLLDDERNRSVSPPRDNPTEAFPEVPGVSAEKYLLNKSRTDSSMEADNGDLAPISTSDISKSVLAVEFKPAVSLRFEPTASCLIIETKTAAEAPLLPETPKSPEKSAGAGAAEDKKAAAKKKWKVGRHCRAVFAEDGKEYEAKILTMLSEDECVVQYLGYENEEQQRIVNLKKSEGEPARIQQREMARQDKAAEASLKVVSKSQAKDSTLQTEVTETPRIHVNDNVTAGDNCQPNGKQIEFSSNGESESKSQTLPKETEWKPQVPEQKMSSTNGLSNGEKLFDEIKVAKTSKAALETNQYSLEQDGKLLEEIRSNLSCFQDSFDPMDGWKVIARKMVAAVGVKQPEELEKWFKDLADKYVKILNTSSGSSSAQQKWPLFLMFYQNYWSPVLPKANVEKIIQAKLVFRKKKN